jgi:cytoskeletal protein RodZ
MFEIGSSLKEARLRQNVDFPQIETTTKIRGKYLQALEDEQFHLLPEETYVKGFLRTYAEYLGLDGQLYVDEYNSRYVAIEEQPIRARRTVRQPRHRRMQRGVLVAALAGIAVVTALVIVAWTSGSPSKQHVVGVTPHGTKQKPQTAKPTKRSVPAPTPKPTITLHAVRSPVVLLAVRKAGPQGKILFENKELSPGQSLRFKRRKLWINTGTPESLRVVVNGRPSALPGGKPQAFVVTARGIFASA